METKKVTVRDLIALKGVRKIVNSAVMDAAEAKMIDASNVDMTGCGVSVAAMIIQGHLTPIPSTLDDVLIYLESIAKAIKRVLVAATLPYGTYQVSNEDTVRVATRYMQSGIDSVKIEGTGKMIDRVHAITSAGINCMGHVGMAPQQFHVTGGYRSVGRSAAEAVQVYKDAMLLQDAGAWIIELECVPWRVADRITADLNILTLGTGSGTGTDGQGLMTHDVWSLRAPVKPRLAKQYDDLHTMSVEAMKRFKQELKIGQFPPEPHVAKISDDEFNRFLDVVG